MFSSCYFSYILFKARLINEISASLSIYTVLCWSSDAPLLKFKLPASSIVQVSSHFSTQQIHCWSVSWWHSQSLRVNVFEFWRARGPSGLARLAKDLICAPALQAYVEHIFLWAALFWTRKCYVQVCRDENLSKIRSESAERNLLSTVTIFQRLAAANVTDLYRNSLTERNWYGDWQLFDDELKLKCFVN